MPLWWFGAADWSCWPIPDEVSAACSMRLLRWIPGTASGWYHGESTLIRSNKQNNYSTSQKTILQLQQWPTKKHWGFLGLQVLHLASAKGGPCGWNSASNPWESGGSMWLTLHSYSLFQTVICITVSSWILLVFGCWRSRFDCFRTFAHESASCSVPQSDSIMRCVVCLLRSWISLFSPRFCSNLYTLCPYIYFRYI